jgi:hypothetical protein
MGCGETRRQRIGYAYVTNRMGTHLQVDPRETAHPEGNSGESIP